MFMAGIKKGIYAFALFAAVLLCGCENADYEPPASTADTESKSEETSNALALQSQEDYPPEKSDAVYSTDPAYSDDNSVAREDNHVYTPEKWVDDALVPEEWILIYTTDEALAHSDEIINADCSGGSVSDVVLSLVNKNVLFFEALYGNAFEIEWENPKKTEDSETVVYPVTTPHFSDLESIYELAFGAYVSPVAEELLFGTKEKPRVLFTETDGCLCVNPDFMSKWVHDPFYPRSYIEITDESEDSLSFILHYPDFEGLNEPREYQYFYYDYQYTATYNDGTWLLDQLILDNGIGLL